MDEAWTGEALVSETDDHAVFAQAMLLPTASSEEIVFTYELPPSVVIEQPDGTWLYRLLFRKQAGVHAVDVHISLRLPENAVLLTAVPELSEKADGTWVYENVTTTDLVVSVQYDVLEED
jgi:hypothetical protein